MLPLIFNLPPMKACMPSSLPSAIAKKSASAKVMVTSALSSPHFTAPLPFFKSTCNLFSPTMSWKMHPACFTIALPLVLTASSICWSTALDMVVGR